MIKTFCTSDIHGRFKDLQKVIDFLNSRKDIDVIIFAGDITKNYKVSSISELAEKQINDYKYFKSMIAAILNEIMRCLKKEVPILLLQTVV